jgi:hypothetical protein
MNPLDQQFQEELQDLITQIQESEELAAFVESEEEAEYLALRETFEPALAELYRKVAVAYPLQILALEELMLDERLEGLYLPKLLGFSVLRGPVNDATQFYYPQEQFRKVLLAICRSANFEELRKRIGQTVQIGFALSSHIWISNLMDEVENRQVRQYLQSQIQEKYYDKEQRQDGYRRYSGQFKDEIFTTVEFPKTLPELRRLFPAVRNFMGRRIQLNLDNSMLLGPVYDLISRDELLGSHEHRYLLVMFINFFDPDKVYKDQVGKIFNKLRKDEPGFNDHYFEILAELHHSKYDITSACDTRVANLIDKKIKDDILNYYPLVEIIHTKGYVHPDVIEEVRNFYSQHQGVSLVNECMRLTIFSYLRKFLNNITVSDYPELFEISKVYAAYFQVFDNEYFKQDVKALNMTYLRKLAKTFTDKRGKDYQDIKRFVQSTFVDLGFLTEKEVVEFFKTRRKVKVEAE